MDKESLLAFEEDIRQDFLAKKIKFPIHFSKGNEEPLIEIFKQIKPGDWVFSTHRSHYHAILKGIPPEWIKAAIERGNSMHLMNAEHKFFASAIVGGSIPIALGMAMAIKRQGGKEWVWCFTGDMAAEAGIFHENQKYAYRFALPITFIVEDNDLSTTTPSRETWNVPDFYDMHVNMRRYRYVRGCPHINTEQWVEFK
jgi:TPP-dependent pyruvate/acetoin dehydrogenase alpha subunit